MPDEATAPVTPDTLITENAAPIEDTQPTPVVDYEARYHSLRPEFDRKSQRLAELEAELEQLQTAQSAYEEAEPEYEEYDDPYLQKLDAIEARILAQEQKDAEREQQDTLNAQYQQESDHITSELETIEKETQDEFSQEESDWIGNYALNHRDEDGKPDVRQATKAYIDLIEGRRAKWVKTKKAPKPGTGAAAVETIDKSSRKSREEAINKLLHEESM